MILSRLDAFLSQRYSRSEMHPDLWPPFVVRDLSQIEQRLAAVAGDKYSYRELEDFTDIMERALLGTGRSGDKQPLVAKVSRSGILSEQVYLVYSQERLAAYGMQAGILPTSCSRATSRSRAASSRPRQKSVFVNPSGEFRSESEIGDVSIGFTPYGTPLYLRDLADTARGYETAAIPELLLLARRPGGMAAHSRRSR